MARRLLNTSPELVKEGLAEEEFISAFEYKLYLSGYDQRERDLILKEGRARYHNIVSNYERGERPMYRPAQWNRKERSIAKLRSQSQWYGSQMDTVLFVQATPGEILRRHIQGVVDRHKLKIKVVEKGGRTIKSNFSTVKCGFFLFLWSSLCGM